MYAVIDLQGHQYIVKKGDLLLVDRVDVKEGGKVKVDNVLSVFDEKWENVVVGTPTVEKATVDCKVKEHKKSKKIRVVKFKNKNRYERNFGFRAHQTILEIKDVKLND